MTSLPIVERELRVAARRWSTYGVRFLVGLAAVVTALFLYASELGLPPRQVGPRIFNGLSVLAFIFCLFAGRRSTADCLSEEKREGTLGLLFLTDLKGYDVVLGKLAATSIHSFYGLLTLLPVLALPLLMGGVSHGQFWRMVLVLINTFLFSLAVGMVASVINKDARNAMGANLLLFFLLAGIPPASAVLIAYLTPSNLFLHGLCYSCPVFAFYLSFDVSPPPLLLGLRDFWGSMAVIHALTWGLVGLASWFAPRCWQDQAARTARLSWRQRWGERWKRWLLGNAAQRKAHRERLLNVNAYYWLASRNRLKPLVAWIALSLAAVWWLSVVFAGGVHWFEDVFTLFTAMILNSLFKVWVAIEASQRLADDRKEGALELLLSTPLTDRDILRGQWLALRRQFLKPLIVALAFELFLVCGVRWFSYESGIAVFAFASIGFLMLLMDLGALVGVGMLAALTARNPNQASLMAVWRVLLVPWIFFSAVAILANVARALGVAEEPQWAFYLGLWFVLGVMADLTFGVRAWWRVTRDFRELALRRSMQADKAPRS